MTSLFRWAWGSPTADNEPPKRADAAKSPEGGCPVRHDVPAGCPMHESTPEALNPRNMMPKLPQTPAEGQKKRLSTERTLSVIPRGREDGDGDDAAADSAYQSAHTGSMLASAQSSESDVWEYPSPQQFYNALRRKGYETREEDVPVMVDIHNFLNDACWAEILRWERLCHPSNPAPSLLRFRGRPNELSPKARLFTLLGADRPFDRHDWTIDRNGAPVRYVIDYYSGYDETLPDGSVAPSFHVDVRPALDSPGALFDRVRMWASEFGGKPTAV